MVSDEAALSDAFADEEPASDFDRDQGVNVSLLKHRKHHEHGAKGHGLKMTCFEGYLSRAPTSRHRVGEMKIQNVLVSRYSGFSKT